MFRFFQGQNGNPQSPQPPFDPHQQALAALYAQQRQQQFPGAAAVAFGQEQPKPMPHFMNQNHQHLIQQQQQQRQYQMQSQQYFAEPFVAAASVGRPDAVAAQADLLAAAAAATSAPTPTAQSRKRQRKEVEAAEESAGGDDSDAATSDAFKYRRLAQVACAACRKAHACCDNNRPCRRCKRLGRPCEDAPDTGKKAAAKQRRQNAKKGSASSSDGYDDASSVATTPDPSQHQQPQSFIQTQQTFAPVMPQIAQSVPANTKEDAPAAQALTPPEEKERDIHMLHVANKYYEANKSQAPSGVVETSEGKKYVIDAAMDEGKQHSPSANSPHSSSGSSDSSSKSTSNAQEAAAFLEKEEMIRRLRVELRMAMDKIRSLEQRIDLNGQIEQRFFTNGLGQIRETPTLFLGHQGRIISMNSSLRHVLDYQPEDYSGDKPLGWFDLFVNEDVARKIYQVSAERIHAKESTVSMHVLLKKRDGSALPALLVSDLFYDHGGTRRVPFLIRVILQFDE